MDKLIDNILSFPSSQTLPESELSKEIQIHLSYLNRVPAATLASTANGTDLLAILDPSVNSLAYLYVLVARLDLGPQNIFDVTWREVATFLESFDPRHVRFAPDIFKRLVEGFSTYASDIGKPLIAVRPIKKAILRFNPHKFSFMHCPYVRLCLEAKCYRDAVAICDIDLIEFPTTVGKAYGRETEGDISKDITYQDVISYFLFAGMVYLGTKEWRRAADFLTYAIVAPGNACSQIQVEAYKKFLLVGLLMDGKPLPIPRVTSVAAARVYRALAKPYEAFAQAFRSGNPDLLRSEIAQLVEVFRQDNNTGLAIQCLEAFRRVQIIALRDTYVTLSTEEIAKRDLEVTGRGGDVGGKEATEGVILGMIERDQISASLSHSSPDPKLSQTIVHFHNNSVDEGRTLSALQSELRRIMTLNKQMKTINKKYGLSKEYVQYTLKLAKFSGSVGGASGASGMGVDPDIMDFDYIPGGWADDEPEETIMQDFDM